MKKFAVLIAGGSGTRLWPLSTPLKPKFFLPYSKKESIIQKHVANINIFLENPAGVGEHEDLLGTIVKEVKKILGTPKIIDKIEELHTSFEMWSYSSDSSVHLLYFVNNLL